MAQYRNVVFTLNNPTGLIMFDATKMEYLVYQEEVGASGTYHFQGYCEFTNRVRMSVVKDLLGGPTVHIEVRRGTQDQAIAYSTKDDTRVAHTIPYEYGQRRLQGKRVDLETFKDLVMAGKRKRDLVDDHYPILARYPKFYDTLTQLNRPTRDLDLRVTLLYGTTGLGKTREVVDRFGDDTSFYVAPLNNGTMWYDTFDGHSRVLLDDFAGAASHISLSSLLRLLDRYPVLVPTKGSHTWWLPNEVFVTTNILPKDWYKWENRASQYLALARRFTSVVMYYEGGSIEQPPTWWKENAPDEAIILY